MSIQSALGVYIVQTNGRSGAGGISVPGVKAGDLAISWWNHLEDAAGSGTLFTFQQTTDDEIGQISGGDISSVTFTIVLVRPNP